MFRLKKLLGIIILSVVAVLCAAGLTACAEPDVDLTGYVAVTFDCMGGTIDKMPTRTLYGKPGTLVVEPKGMIGLVEAKRLNYSLIGWYTAHGEGRFDPSAEGDYVYYYEFTENENGDYVAYEYYYENAEGSYVLRTIEGETVYDVYNPDNAEHIGLVRYARIIRYKPYVQQEDASQDGAVRYSASRAYVLYDRNNPDHAELSRYVASYEWDENDRWNFDTDRIGDEAFTLYARWAYNLKIFWDYQDDKNTVYTYENGRLEIEINRGQAIPQTSLIPTKSGHTFTFWYKDKECTERWDFDTDVFPVEDEITAITLYAGYIEGAYTRISTAKQFVDALNKDSDKNGRYLLVDDIDFGGEVQKFSDGKVTVQGEKETVRGTVFKGEINGLGNTVSGIKINAKGTDAATETQTVKKFFGFFGQTDGAVIKNVNFVGEIVFDTDSVNEMYIGTVIGRDKGGSTIENVTTEFTLTATDESLAVCNAWISGGIALKGTDTAITDCNFADAEVLGANIVTSGTKTIVR